MCRFLNIFRTHKPESEWVYIEYKDTFIPMRAWQKEFEWDKMNAEQKREKYKQQEKMIKKGEVIKEYVDEVHFLLIPTKKSSEAKKQAVNYEKFKNS